MSITNGYITLQEYKEYARITTANAVDDGVIERLIESASRQFEALIPLGPRTFYTRTAETRYFNCPYATNDNLLLWLDEDLLSIDANGLINGDGTVIPATEYTLLPRNTPPYFAIHLKRSSNIRWEPDEDGEFEGVISVKGSWGYAATAPADVKEAVSLMVKSAYSRRTGENQSTTSLATAAGVVITPEDIPAKVKQIANSFRRLV